MLIKNVGGLKMIVQIWSKEGKLALDLNAGCLV